MTSHESFDSPASAFSDLKSLNPMMSASAATPTAAKKARSAPSAATEAMGSVCDMVQTKFSAAVKAAFGLDHVAMLTPATKPEFGEYQCNSAMSLSKTLKSVPDAPKKPQEIAAAIIGRVDNSDGMFKELQVAGPGFINVHLSKEWMGSQVMALVRYGASPPKITKRKVAVDFSSPNVAKEMHVGHLRSTIIGDTISRILEYCGHEVLRINHVGDWGTQFGMLIAHLKDSFPDFLNKPPPIADLQEFYKASKVRFDEDEDFKARAHNEVVELQGGNTASKAAWTMLCNVSRAEFQKLYSRLDVKLSEVGESFYNPYIPHVIQALIDQKTATEENGAKVVWSHNPKIKHQMPLIVQKSDGGYGYDSTDVTAVWWRLLNLQCDWLIYITDDGQKPHFDLVFECARAAGWTNENTRLDHVGFGLVCGEDGKKFKTRSGTVVKLVELLDESAARMLVSVKERGRDAESGSNDSEDQRKAEVIGYAAVKYADLRQNRVGNYIFSFDRMLSTDGNTAVYLLYQHARIASIFHKAGIDLTKRDRGDGVVLGEPEEHGLARTLLKFPEVVNNVLVTLTPNLLCEYLYEVSQAFSAFHNKCRVLDNEHTESRLNLCEATLVVMRKAFDLLGMHYLDRM